MESLYCKICNTALSGRIPAQQHYSSAAHKKREATARTASYHPYFCHFCNKACDTQKILEEHNKSPRHNAEVEKQRRQTQPASGDHMNGPVTQNANTSKEYVFDGNRGYCNVCSLELTSSSHATSHLQGQKHEKKKKQKEMLQHASFAPKAQPVFPQNRDQSAVKVGITANPITTGSAHFCELCQCQFTGPENAQQHYISVNHRKKETEARLAETGELLPLRCEVCDCSFTGQESARDHFNGTKHKRNAENKKIKGVQGFAPNMTDSDKLNTSYNESELDRASTGVSNINLYTPASFHKFQHLTKQSEADEESIIKPYPADESSYSEPAYIEDLKADPNPTGDHVTHSFSSQVRRDSREEHTDSLGDNDEKKIRAETYPSLEGGSSLSSMLSSSTTSISPDSFSQSSQPVQFIQNNLRSSMPSFGRGRAPSELKNSNAIIGKLLEKNNEKPSACSVGMHMKKSDDDSQHTGTVGFQPNVGFPQTVIDSRSDVSRLGCQVSPTLPVTREPTQGEEYTFDRYTGRGKCYVCNIELTSVNHMTQHVTGKKHISAASVWKKIKPGIRPSENLLVCPICVVTFTDPESRKQHYESEKHIQKERQARGEDRSFFCSICNIPCSGEISYQQHIAGSQHHKRAGTSGGVAAGGIPFDQTVWHHCDICGCAVNSFEQLAIHKTSHTPSPGLTNAGDLGMAASAFNVDRTAWYTCKVCMCNLNSESQFRIHEQSPAHLKKLATSGAPVLVRPSQFEYEHLNVSHGVSQPENHESGHLTPLQSFLSEELFPAEFLPKTEDCDNAGDNTQASVNAPFNLVTSDDPVPYQEKYVKLGDNDTAAFSQGADASTGSGGARRGQGSDLAFATRSKGSGARNTDNATKSESNGFERDTSGVGAKLNLGARPKEMPVRQAVVNPYADTHSFYCHTCKRPMNTRESYENHLRGKNHMQKVCTEPAPVRRHLDPVQLPPDYKPKLVTSPRNYQMELYQKSLQQDSLCFLPTGTGKTLVSVALISAMLEKHPSRNVLFLVDKVLLVLQQAKYIKEELQGENFLRCNPDSEEVGLPSHRGLQIAAVCMGQQNTQGVPLWKHDVVVVTAAFCQNLLEKKILRWEDFSLVVFDESHHCEKAHPFNSLLINFHNNTPLNKHRPKVLGLTASPAGKADVPKTVAMLESLLLNMGGVSMAVVEKPENVQTLQEFQSNARMIIQSQATESDSNVTIFKHELSVYIMHCFLKLLQVSDIQSYISVKGVSAEMSASDVARLAGDFVDSIFDVLQSSLSCLSCVTMEKVVFSQLTRHVSSICMALSSLIEGGTLSMLEELIELQTSQYGFDFAKDIGLPCNKLLTLVRHHNSDESGVKRNDGAFPGLLRVLTEAGRGHVGGKRSMSLVLVKTRATAHTLTKTLTNSADLKRLGLNTAMVVGHGGSGATDRGMSVNQQKRVLEEIKQFMYQIIIATSVAEEGVDWPECERVISLYPPATVTALVQMRGRARRKDSQFVVLCASPAAEEKLRDIMRREENMIKATQILVQRAREQHQA